MPTYGYTCNCGAYFEEMFKKVVDRETHTCPNCGEVAKNVPVAPGMFRFKGWWPGEQIKKSNATDEYKQKELEKHGFIEPDPPLN